MEWLSDNWLELLGWTGSALLVTSLLQARVLRLRVLNSMACLLLIAYNGLIGVWPMFAMNIVLFIINVTFVVKLTRTRHDEATYSVIEVSATDAYLRHFLAVHGEDIAKFHPNTPPLESDDLAYQVLKGDETVGVIILRCDADVARVLIDYVTPRFRDFEPGEFVWRTTEGLRARGFRKVVTPPDMVAPYYERLGVGFRREGASYALEL